MARSSNSEAAASAGKKRQTSFNGKVFVAAARHLDTPKVTMELETIPAPEITSPRVAPEPIRPGRKMTIAFTELRPQEAARLSSLAPARPKSTLAFEEDALERKAEKKSQRAAMSVQSFVYGKRSHREDESAAPTGAVAPDGAGSHTMQLPSPWLQRKLFKLDGEASPRASFWYRHGALLKAALLALVAAATAVAATRGYRAIADWFA